MNRDRIDALLAATWPPAATRTLGPWTLRDGKGGGKRVSAASTRETVSAAEIDAAERAMDDAGRQALFSVFAGQDDLDRQLSDRTYLTLDPTVIYVGSIAHLAGGLRSVHDGCTIYADPCTEDAHPVHASPTDGARPGYDLCTADTGSAGARAIWSAGGIGPARVAIMDRVTAPKTVLLATCDGTPAACAFIALHDGTAMLHALETAKAHRRQGAGKATLSAALGWARDRGCAEFALLVTRANAAANALYRAIGMNARPCYHYRIRP